MKPTPMDNQRYCTVVEDLVRRCIAYRDDRHKDRLRAIEYYEGTMTDLPKEKGRSQVVSRDVRAAINKVRPSVIRTILGGESVVEFAGNDDADEEQAPIISDFFNEILLPECRVHELVDDVTHDAMLLRNGVAHWYMDTRREPKVTLHTGLAEDELVTLISGEGVEVLEHSEKTEFVEGMEMPVHDVKIMRVTTKAEPKLCAVPIEEFLIHPDALSVDNAQACGRYRTLTRSDLIAMGYDPAKVNDLPSKQSEEDTNDLEDRRRDSIEEDNSPVDRSGDEIEFYEMFVRIDKDGDGLAELRRVVMAGGTKETNLLEDDYTDEAPFADIVIERKPHTWEGVSIADDAIEIQRIKTSLLRSTLDNIYWQNKPQPIIQADKIEDPDAVLNPGFGKPIRIRAGASIDEAIQFRPVPFVAKDSFAMLPFFDQMLEDRTGINEASGGLAPDALQNMTAKGAALIEQGGIARTELMVRNIANGLRRAFKGLYKLVIQHSEKPRMVRLKGKPMEIDPRHWNMDMDVTVNVGLGAGSRERDLMALSAIEQTQAMIATQGPHLGIVTPENIYETAIAKTAAAGMKTPQRFFTQPAPDTPLVPPQGPNPEMIKLQAQMELEKAKMEAQRDKEAAQGEADVAVAQQKAILDREAQDRDAELKREEIASRERIETAKLAQAREIELFKLKMTDTEEGVQSREDVRASQLMQSFDILRSEFESMRQKKPKRYVISRDPMTGDMMDISEANDDDMSGMVQ